MQNIICKEAFNKLKKDFEGIRTMHVSWIYDIWERAEAAMQKRSSQKPALEYKVTPMYRDKDHEVYAQEYEFISPLFKQFTKTKTLTKVTYQNNQFTREELQLLKTILTAELNELHEEKLKSKDIVRHNWDYCDKEKDNRSSRFHFMALNAEKNFLRGLSKRYNKLAEIQCKIKKQLT